MIQISEIGFGGLLSSSKLTTAIKANKKYADAQMLGWGGWIVAVNDVLVAHTGTRYPDLPNELDFPESFAEAVAQYQKENNLAADGILGPNTFERFLDKFGSFYSAFDLDFLRERLNTYKKTKKPSLPPKDSSIIEAKKEKTPVVEKKKEKEKDVPIAEPKKETSMLIKAGLPALGVVIVAGLLMSKTSPIGGFGELKTKPRKDLKAELSRLTKVHMKAIKEDDYAKAYNIGRMMANLIKQIESR